MSIQKDRTTTYVDSENEMKNMYTVNLKKKDINQMY